MDHIKRINMEEELYEIQRRIRPEGLDIDEYLRKSHVLYYRGEQIFIGTQIECVWEKVKREKDKELH